MSTRLLLLFGGESSEHEVSIVSARNVYDALDKDKYDVLLCYIARNGEWGLVESLDENAEGHVLIPVLGQEGTFMTADRNIFKVDVILPILHGAHGEDGDVQGLARLMGVPCVGPSLIGAAITMDKDVTKRLLRDAGVPVVNWITWHTSVAAPDYGEVVSMLGEVVFVKPANAGSSVGVSKVRSEKEYAKALKTASEHDQLVLIEKAINAREIEVAVLGNGANIRVSEPGEIIPGEEFYSYDDKYADDSKSRAEIPAKLSSEAKVSIKELSIVAYLATRGQGMARIDYFVDENDTIYLNEINAIPGFTNISMYPKLMQHGGLSYQELIDQLISLAIEAGA